MELISLVNKNLDLVEKAYFGLQFTDTLQVSVSMLYVHTILYCIP